MFDELLKSVGGGQGADLMRLIGEAVQGQGGLQGLAQQAQGAGLGEQMSSWVSAGENLPLSGDQAQGLLGHEFIQSAAAKLGLDQGQIAQMASQILPGLVDQLTPGGQMPEGQDLMGSLQGLLGGNMPNLGGLLGGG